MLLSLLLLIPFLGALALILWPGSPSSARLRDVSIVLLVVQCLVCCLSNGALPSIQSYSCLPYGNTVITLSKKMQ